MKGKMPNDLTFADMRVRSSTRYQAQRRAVLNVLSPGWSDIPAALSKVVSMWRNRVYELHAAGWKPAAAGVSRQFLRNCPPFGATTTFSRPCGYPRLCPMCYARMIVQVAYDRIDALCDAGPGRKLMVFRGARSYPAGDGTEAAYREAVSYRADCGTFARTRLREKNLFPSYGGFVFYRFTPDVKNTLRVSKYGVVVLKGDQDLGDPAEKEGKGNGVLLHWSHEVVEPAKRPNRVTKKALADTLGSLLAYDRNELECPAKHVLVMNEALYKKRTFYHWGRKPKPAIGGNDAEG